MSFLISLLPHPLPEKASHYFHLNSLTLLLSPSLTYPTQFFLIAVSIPNIYEFIYLFIVDLSRIESSLHGSRENVSFFFSVTSVLRAEYSQDSINICWLTYQMIKRMRPQLMSKQLRQLTFTKRHSQFQLFFFSRSLNKSRVNCDKSLWTDMAPNIAAYSSFFQMSWFSTQLPRTWRQLSWANSGDLGYGVALVKRQHPYLAKVPIKCILCPASQLFLP